MTKIVNDIKRGDLANCIMLHDFAIARPDLKKWTEYVADFFNKYGIVPTRIGGHTRTAKKTVNFNNGIRKLEANNYDTDHIWIGALPPKHNSDMFCSIFTTKISMRENNTNCCSLIFDNEIVGFDAAMIDKLALDLAGFTGARYGYGFQRLFSRVVGYEWGALSGLEIGNPERRYVGEWGRVYKPNGSYKTGDMRDIYPVNILSREHIKRDIDGETLENWISGNPRHGKLLNLSRDKWSWHVELDNIEYVRESLRHTGIILCI